MKKSTVILVWGGITGILTAVYYQVINMNGAPNSGLLYLTYLILFAGLFIGLLQYRKANGGYLTFGAGYGAAMLMTLIVAVICLINLAVTLSIHPDFIDKILAKAQQDMINKGLTDDQIEIGMHYTRLFTTPAMLYIFSVLGNLFGGAILGLIAAGLTSKKKPFFEEGNQPANTDLTQA